MFPHFKGGAIRGGLGYALRRLVCPDLRAQCPECSEKFACAYSMLYESPVPPDARMMRLYPAAPHPFVVEPPLGGPDAFEAGEVFEFGLVLVGRAIAHLPALVAAVRELGASGLGANRGRFELEQVAAADRDGRRHAIYSSADGNVATDPTTIDCPLSNGATHADTLALELLTPTRIKFQGRLCDQLDFHVLIRSLLRRVSALGCFYCDIEPDADFSDLVDRAARARTVEAEWQWVDWPRYSTRQRQPMRLGGVTGRARYAGVDAALWPYVQAGAFLHVGKAATFGLGRLRVVQPNASGEEMG